MPTEILSLPEIAENQAGKYITHNEALRQVESYMAGVLSRRSTPPDSPVGGDTHIVQPDSYAVVAVDTGARVFKVSGDHESEFALADTLKIQGSTANDGTYTVASVAYNEVDDNTEVTVSEAIPDGTADGDLLHAQGLFNGQDDRIAHYYSGAWAFHPPPRGIRLLVLDESVQVYWDPAQLRYAVLDGAGDVVGPAASTDQELPRYDGTNGKVLQGSGLLVDDQQRLSGHGSQVHEVTGTSHTLGVGDNGRVIATTSSDPVTVILPENATTALPPGFQCVVIQRGSGAVSVATEGTDVLESRADRTTLGGRHSVATVLKLVNGTPNTWGLYGDLA